jgi:hypothetical protein
MTTLQDFDIDLTHIICADDDGESDDGEQKGDDEPKEPTSPNPWF